MDYTALLAQFMTVAAIVFVACVLFSRIVRDRDVGRNLDRVLNGDEQAAQARSLSGSLLRALREVGAFVQNYSIFSAKDVAELEKTARAAGFAPENAVPVVIGGKLIMMLVCPVVAFLLSHRLAMPWPVVWSCAGAALGMFGPNTVIAYARRKRTKALRLGLSDALDLLVVCTEAGLGLETAISRVAAELKFSNQPVAMEFMTLSQDLRLSSDRSAALIRMGDRTGLVSFQRLTMTLAQTLRYGTPLGQALRSLAIEMRNDRMLALEEKAARLPTLMMIPLAIFILPCLFIVVAGPAALRVLSMMN